MKGKMNEEARRSRYKNDMFLHVTMEQVQDITIRTVDTKMVAPAVSLFQRLNVQKLWIELGARTNKRGPCS